VSLLELNQGDQQALTPTSFDISTSVVGSSSASGLLLLLLMLLLDSVSSPEIVCASHRHRIWKAMNTGKGSKNVNIVTCQPIVGLHNSFLGTGR
jgi:hypothetical protein